MELENQTLNPEQMWDKFIKHLNVVEPLGRPKKDELPAPHRNFIGSISAYRKLFLEANKHA